MPTIPRSIQLLCLAVAAACLSGCTSFSDYVHNGFKVGPEYTAAKAAVAPQWIDAADIRVRSRPRRPEPLVERVQRPRAQRSDLPLLHARTSSLKEYGTRILQARANLAIAKGELFPQTQTATGSYQAASNLRRIRTSPPFPKFNDRLELRLQPGLGTGLLGPLPPRR